MACVMIHICHFFVKQVKKKNVGYVIFYYSCRSRQFMSRMCNIDVDVTCV